ncbi:HpcH/HpaI aldolase/citrate lyase family protein [Mycobacterium sp. AZCC_0083]|uniref:HpcH/HpaI aldolase family protein n=1 Tax=Mycobacterium sp. AZCC_0083 TaxID=2735882 RepID=UPI001622B664|nr:aldolase/citrate lyase family protein [Mycobacterium sp. AZCC_0083]MBB5167834.1 2-keto-3-deoxy-L-rhamnonate aldolase RhmA [Mycobacterium sp. AZCC_0083]
MRDNPLLKRLREGSSSVASFITIPDPFTAEVMGAAGVDLVVVDTEHSAMSAAQLQGVLTALHPTEAAVVVRVADNNPALVGQALDLGAEGVLIPGVRSRADCDLAVRSCFYAPKGIRGFGPRRASRLHGGRADYIARVNDEIAVIAMIEHVDALDDLDGIVSTDDLTAVFVGTADLAVSMGYLHDLANPAVTQAVMRIATVCLEQQMPFGVFTGNEEAAATWITRGAQIVTMGSDLQYLDAGVASTRQSRAKLLRPPDRASTPVSH